ncbi:MAG: hypothetical protein H6677_16400 [Candidatus Obscuribacterales bacterium]|nr:hypothetical protein [Candidatus Obscuribacterales bacterium]
MDWNIFLKILELLLSAPSTSAFCILVFMLCFNNEIRLLFSRLKQAKSPVGSIELETASIKQIASQQTEEIKLIEGNKGPVLSENPPSISPTVNRIEHDMRSQLEEVEENRRIDVLLRACAANLTMYQFSRMHIFMFGSQLKLLEKMNSGPITKRTAKVLFYDPVYISPYNNVTEENTTMLENLESNFELWFNHLVSAGLVEESSFNLDSEDREIYWILTEKGKDFVHFLVLESLPLDKPFS